jgi:hypothetical protein
MVVMVTIGAVVGVLSFVASFFGFDPKVRVIAWDLHGIPGGVAAIFVCPFLGAVFSLIVGVLASVCLNLGMRILRGIEVQGVWDDAPSSCGVPRTSRQAGGSIRPSV